jgi:hypothetical protein
MQRLEPQHYPRRIVRWDRRLLQEYAPALRVRPGRRCTRQQHRPHLLLVTTLLFRIFPSLTRA